MKTNIELFEELFNKAVTMLKENDNLFVGMVESLDSENGYADGFRCYNMEYELDELCGDMTLSDFLDQITKDFNHNDEWFYWSIYGLESTNDRVGLYRANVEESDLVESLIDNNAYFPYNAKELENIINELEELREKVTEDRQKELANLHNR